VVGVCVEEGRRKHGNRQETHHSEDGGSKGSGDAKAKGHQGRRHAPPEDRHAKGRREEGRGNPTPQGCRRAQGKGPEAGPHAQADDPTEEHRPSEDRQAEDDRPAEDRRPEGGGHAPPEGRHAKGRREEGRGHPTPQGCRRTQGRPDDRSEAGDPAEDDGQEVHDPKAASPAEDDRQEDRYPQAADHPEDDRQADHPQAADRTAGHGAGHASANAGPRHGAEPVGRHRERRLAVEPGG
jgi:hypothetical protein